MTAFDSLDEGRKATSDVTILVTRNAHEPEFDDDSYKTTVDELQKPGEPFITIKAEDDDDVSLSK